MNRRFTSSRKGPVIGFVAFTLILLVIILAFNFFRLSSRTTETCTIESKERTVQVQDGNSSQQKLVYTSCGVFEVQDSFLLLKFNSADTYGYLKEGQTYELDYYGWRIGLFSFFPNIVGATPVD